MPYPDRPPTVSDLKLPILQLMDAAWIESGYTAPNTVVYPWLWLWDSCFHALIWAGLGRPDRAMSELLAALENQGPSGFVPHMGYQRDPDVAVDLWGRRSASSITQPPMYGHVVRALVDQGVNVPETVLGKVRAGFRFLFEERRREPVTGLVTVVHPWETGCDDSPRWDHFCPGRGFDLARWRQHKIELLSSVEYSADGAPLANPAFAVAPIGFNALVAWNAMEFASVTGDQELSAQARELADRISQRWRPEVGTWADGGPDDTTSGEVRTADALCALLVVDNVDQRRSALRSLDQTGDFGGQFGPRGVHPDEPTYDPATYWRGPVWPQLAYLLWLAADREGSREVAERVRQRTLAGAVASGFAEYWNGETGVGGGAIPQSWAGVALLMATD